MSTVMTSSLSLCSLVLVGLLVTTSGWQEAGVRVPGFGQEHAGVVADEVHIEYHPRKTFGTFSDSSSWTEDWSVLYGTVGGRLNQARCVDIPVNMSLCRGIGYGQMRLPNLLDHDSLAEATQQAASWIPLLNIRCHDNTRMFLCSLFAPVCLDRPIWPCRTLCQAVQTGCETRMLKYGFPWPEMLRCDKFPLENDLCVGLQTGQQTADNATCGPCDQPDTFENVVDNFCSAEFVLKVRISQTTADGSGLKIVAGKKKIYKRTGLRRKELRGEKTYHLESAVHCQCDTLNSERSARTGRASHLVMGVRKNDRLVLTLVYSLERRSRSMNRALRAIRQETICDAGIEAVASVPYRVNGDAKNATKTERDRLSSAEDNNDRRNKKRRRKQRGRNSRDQKRRKNGSRSENRDERRGGAGPDS